MNETGHLPPVTPAPEAPTIDALPPEPPTPRRQFEVTIRVSAETWQLAQLELLEITEHVSKHGPACNSVSGGGSSSHSVEVVHDPIMTNERHREELFTYVDWLKATDKKPPTYAVNPFVDVNFGAALVAMKHGWRAARAGWNGKGMWLAVQNPDENSKMGAPYIYMSPVDGKLVPWLASQTDMLAEDWMVLR